MSVSTEVDLSQTPITALRERTRRYIEHALNEKMVLPTDDDLELSRDWQGLVSLINLDHQISHQSLNPTKDALNLWKEEALQKEQKVPSLKELQSIFCQLDRWDIFYDTEEMILNDAIFYKKSLQLEPSAPSKHLQHGCLTSYDINRYLEGKELLDYDAFVLYAEEDAEFARVLKDKLEQVYRLSVVCKEDLITAGFELQALTNLITRCSALIVIMSPTLFKTENNKYLLGFAEAVSVEQRKSRIIPCRYQPCTIPRENSTLQYLVCHDYVRLTNLQIDFFKKVSQSVQAAGLASGMCVRRLAPIQSLPEVERCKITEVKSEEEVSLAPEKPVSMETAIVCLSDASTHFPGNTLENSLDNKWDVCSQNVSDTDSKFEVMKKTDKSTSFLSKKKKWFKEKKKNWWKKERAVALVT